VTEKMQRAMRIVSQHLDAIQREVFKADAGMKLTFIARDPNNPEADFLLSEDDLYEVGQLIVRSAQRENSAPQPKGDTP
jgi:hypothetical protein